MLISTSTVFAASGDFDDDGYSDVVELSEGTDPFDANSKPDDHDNDIIPDSTDPDDDNDGVNDIYDTFPFNASEWIDTDNDGIGNNADQDDDNDNYPDTIEIEENSNPLNPFSIPEDSDEDLDPDSTDPDDDNDGHPDEDDTFPKDATEWLDTDGDGIGNNADPDDDGDGYLDEVEVSEGTDTLDNASIPDDYDKDYIPDSTDPDDDNDGVPDSNDAFPFDATEMVDTDKDGIGDITDTDDDNDGYSDIVEISEGSDPLDALSMPVDHDSDLFPDSSDLDDDNDGVTDAEDSFPFDPAETMDSDGDGIGDNADLDDDNDGYSDAIEMAEKTDTKNSLSRPKDHDDDLDPDSTDEDDDNDGVVDTDDAFPLDASESQDTDGDGLGNNSDMDDDSDGILDSDDDFPLDSEEYSDLDSDGVGDNADPDDDGDGVLDDHDIFPKDSGEWSDIDGDGKGDQSDYNSWRDGFETGDLSRWDDYTGAFSGEAVISQAAYSQKYGCQVKGAGNMARSLHSRPHMIILEGLLFFHQWGHLSFDIKGPSGDNIGSVTILSKNQLRYSSLSEEIFEYAIPFKEWIKVRLERNTSEGTIRFFIDDQIIYSRQGDQKNVLIESFEIESNGSVLADLDDIGYFLDDDLDKDGVANDVDSDDDGDGLTDGDDVFPLDLSEWVDTDGDGLGNNKDTDDDGDMIEDVYDDFPLDVSEWADTDEDSVGNNADDDDDNDGVIDEWDVFPLDNNEWVDADDDGMGDNQDFDDDNDGIDDETEAVFGMNSFGVDSDGDGVPDADEPLPFEDSDQDGLINAKDPDSDNDGVPDGVEMGIAEPVAGKAFILGTKAKSLDSIIDHDPTTTTDPLNPDTDGGGLTDGEEDLNLNGRLDHGERNPLFIDDDVYPDSFVGSDAGGCQLIIGGEKPTRIIIVQIILMALAIGLVLRKFQNGNVKSFMESGIKI